MYPWIGFVYTNYLSTEAITEGENGVSDSLYREFSK